MKCSLVRRIVAEKSCWTWRLDRATGTSIIRCRFETVNFLNEAPPGGFQLVFDRGCFHTFAEDHERARFAQNVAAVLVNGGIRLSLLGSSEGAPRDVGPPRRTAREIMNAIDRHWRSCNSARPGFTPWFSSFSERSRRSAASEDRQGCTRGPSGSLSTTASSR
jgi:hypothetical protein